MGHLRDGTPMGANLKTSLTIPFLTIHPPGLRTVNGLSFLPLGVETKISM